MLLFFRFKSFLSLRSVDGEVENDLEDEDLGENLEKDVEGQEWL